MTAPRVAAYGSWPSPLSAERLAAGSVRFGHLQLRDGAVWWSESRPTDGGRSTIVVAAPGEPPRDASPPGFDARSRVHEYGGGAFCVGDGGVVYASHDGDGQVHRIVGADRASVPITRGTKRRHADLVFDATRRRLVAVREDHGEVGEAVNAIVAIALDGADAGHETVLASGHDFFACPALSPDGRAIAWLTWDHPSMPWRGSDLWLAVFDADGHLGTPRHVAGGERESIVQPTWSPAGELHYASDRSGWWNLYRDRAGTADAVCPMAAEFARPAWQFGQSMFGFEASGAVVCAFIENGVTSLGRIERAGAPLERIGIGEWGGLHHVRVGDGVVVAFADAPHEGESLLHICLGRPAGTAASVEVVRRSSDVSFDPADVSVAEAIHFASDDGAAAHAWFYPPTNAACRGPPDGTLPPLLVVSHGGPTGMTERGLRPAIQYFTQRGFAVVDVNYGGSTGYGRAYRDRLDGAWGVVDVADVVAAARHLVATGRVDGARLCIRGASAGGYTTLAALAFRPGVFKAGASHYGIGDLAALARDTHKFESRYLDSLVGPWPAAEAIYRARSPIDHVDAIDSALILFQGDEDKSVPPSQAEAMHAAVRDKGLAVAYLLVPGEQHGFRQARHIRRALEAELAFYGHVLGFTPADAIEPVPIENA